MMIVSIIITVILIVFFFIRALILLIIISIFGVDKTYGIDGFKLATVAVIGTFYIYFITTFIPGISQIFETGTIRYIISAITYVVILKLIYKDQGKKLKEETAKNLAENRDSANKTTK